MKRLFYYIAIFIFAIIFISCCVILFFNLSGKKQFQSDIGSLVELIDYTSVVMEASHDKVVTATDITVSSDKTYDKDFSLNLPDYSKLYKANSDFIGWLSIKDTIVDYPVMQTISEPEYYIDRDFYNRYSKYGLPFVSADCDLLRAGDSILIYGHHMKDGSIFGSLSKYEDVKYYEQHPVICFDTLIKRSEYRIFAVFKTTVSDKGFDYYNYVDLDDEDRFNIFISTVRELDIVNTGIVPQYGNRIMILSTCEYSALDGRLVVVAYELK